MHVCVVLAPTDFTDRRSGKPPLSSCVVIRNGRPSSCLFRERETRMRRTGGGQRGSRNRALRLRQRWQYVPLVKLRGGPTIEPDEPNAGMGVKESAKIVGNRVIRDVGIETTGTRGRREHVPKRDALLYQHPNTPRVVGRQVGDLRRDDLPE